MKQYSILRITHPVILFFCIIWLILVFSPPILLEGNRTLQTAGHLVRLFFSQICHQQTDRCFIIAGHSIAVCARCIGIYIGFFLGVLGFPLLKRRIRFLEPRSLLLLAGLPTVMEFLILRSRGIDLPALFRGVTGALLGFAAALLILPLLTEVKHAE